MIIMDATGTVTPVVFGSAIGSVDTTPFIARNTSGNIYLDASAGDAMITLQYAVVNSANKGVIVSSHQQTIIVIDTRLPIRAIRPDPSGTVTYKLSPHAQKVDWNVTKNSGAPSYNGTTPPFSFTANLPLGIYTARAHYGDLYHPQGGATYYDFEPEVQVPLYVVDVVTKPKSYKVPAVKLPLHEATLDPAKSSPDAMIWTLSPDLPNGARLYTSSYGGGNGSITVTNPGSVWFSAGTVVTNYTLTAKHPNPYATNILDTATITTFEAPITLVPDHNRDKTIDGSDRGKVTTATPWRWWINDDKDDGDISDGDKDIPGQSNGNCADNVVNGRCDLNDFFPIWIDTTAHSSLNSDILDRITYCLKQEDGAVNVVYTDLTRSQAGNFFIVNAATYGSTASEPPHQAATCNVPPNGITLANAFVQRMRLNPQKGVLMFEGRKATTNPLVIEVLYDGVKISQYEFPLSISPVQDMHRWINIRPSGASRQTRTNLPTVLIPNAMINMLS